MADDPVNSKRLNTYGQVDWYDLFLKGSNLARGIFRSDCLKCLLNFLLMLKQAGSRYPNKVYVHSTRNFPSIDTNLNELFYSSNGHSTTSVTDYREFARQGAPCGLVFVSVYHTSLTMAGKERRRSTELFKQPRGPYISCWSLSFWCDVSFVRPQVVGKLDTCKSVRRVRWRRWRSDTHPRHVRQGDSTPLLPRSHFAMFRRFETKTNPTKLTWHFFSY